MLPYTNIHIHLFVTITIHECLWSTHCTHLQLVITWMPLPPLYTLSPYHHHQTFSSKQVTRKTMHWKPEWPIHAKKFGCNNAKTCKMKNYINYTANHPLIWISNRLIHADASVAIANIDFCCSTNTHAVQQIQSLHPGISLPQCLQLQASRITSSNTYRWQCSQEPVLFIYTMYKDCSIAGNVN